MRPLTLKTCCAKESEKSDERRGEEKVGAQIKQSKTGNIIKLKSLYCHKEISSIFQVIAQNSLINSLIT